MGIFSSHRRIREIEDDLASTMREVKSLRVEWDETYEKLLKLYRKTAAERVKLEKQTDPATPEPETNTESSNGNGDISGSFLTPKQKLIQQQILRRRAGRI